MNNNRDPYFLGMFYGVFRPAFSFGAYKGMNNVGVFSDEAISGIIGFCEFGLR